jgi:enoyl-CoA hydratase/carnithine racemase
MTCVLYDKRDRIAYVTLNRPRARNAIDLETHEALCETWADFRDDDDVDVAILTGAGDEAFCAGADLRTYIPPIIRGERRIRASERARFGSFEARRGYHHGDGGIVRLVNACGVGVASHLLLTAEPIDAAQALQWNLVTKVVVHDALMAEAEVVARQILRNSQRAVRSAKETILDVVGKDLDDQLRTEACNAYTVADPDETLGLLQRFYDRTDAGRA